MKTRTALILLALSTLIAATAYAATVKITDGKFVYNGVSYFRGKAENVNLASYGEKKTPIGKTNYLAVQNQVNRDKLDEITIKFSGPYSIDWSKFSNADVDISIKYLTNAGGTAGFSRSAAKSADLKLVKMAIDEGPLKTLLNKHAQGARNYLADEGGDGRIVSEVWIAMEGKIASDVTTCGSVSGKAGADGIEVAIDTKLCKRAKSTVTLPANTTFAYMLHKVKKWNKGKTKVEDLEDDQKGLN